MTCTEYQTLSDGTQVAVIAVHGVNKNPCFAAMLIGIFCERHTGDTVAQVINRIKPEFLYK